MDYTLEDRLALAWTALSKATTLPDRQFWAAFDEIETATLVGLNQEDSIRATQALHAYLAKLRAQESGYDP